MKIAIIGTGISGLGVAYLLSREHDIVVYEKNSYIGGHSRTIDVFTGEAKTPVDSGFIVFNDWNYPNLTGLFRLLDVPYEKSDMSFGVSIDDGWLEYSSSNIFAQKENILRPQFLGMLKDIVFFNKRATSFIQKHPEITLGECLDQLKMGDWFRQYYLLAMGAAIWSSPIKTVMQFPARTFIKFFENHGLLNIIKRPQWYTVSGGSREYVELLTSGFKDKIKLDCGVKTVSHQGSKIIVEDTHGDENTFDRVVFACHADEALNMIENPTDEQKNVIGAFGYQDNKIIVHSDISFMPKNKKSWASWVYLSEKGENDSNYVSLSYWMNNLQNLDDNYPIIVTLNPERRPQGDLIHDEHTFTHPVFDLPAVRAQKDIKTIQGVNDMWFCGAYQRYGFHEDGLLSAVNVAKSMGVKIPWE